MRKCITLIFTLLFASLCWGQYGKTETTVPTDLTSYLPTVDLWKTLPGGGICAVNTLSVASTGYIACVGTTGYAFSYSMLTRTWTQLTALGTGIKAIAAQDAAHIWVLKASAGCDDGHNPVNLQNYMWNGSAYVTGTGCQIVLSIGSDGTLVGTNWQGDTYKSTNGTSWTQISGHAVGPNLNYVSVSTSSVMCGTLGPQVFTLVAGHFTLLPHMPANSDTGISGCAIAGTSMYAWGPSLVYVQSYNFSSGTWSYVAGGNKTSLKMGSSKYFVFALGANGAPQHLNILVPYHSSTISGSWTNGCGGVCPGGATHTATNHSFYPNGLAGSTVVSAGSPGTNLNATSFDFTGVCDPLMGDPSDPACQVADVGTVHCSILGSDIFTEANPFQCFLNAVPPDIKLDFPLPHGPRGWQSGGGPVLVYINSNDYANGSLGYTAICNGIKSWAPGNQKTYSCFSNNGVPSPEPTSNYIYVSKGGNRSSTDPCGPTPYYSCPPAHLIHHVWMQIDNTATTSQQIQGNAAHEEGHDNFMKDCDLTCQDHGSVMGSGSTNAANQKTAPTNCDIFWYIYYAILWGGPA